MGAQPGAATHNPSLRKGPALGLVLSCCPLEFFIILVLCLWNKEHLHEQRSPCRCGPLGFKLAGTQQQAVVHNKHLIWQAHALGSLGSLDSPSGVGCSWGSRLGSRLVVMIAVALALKKRWVWHGGSTGTQTVTLVCSPSWEPIPLTCAQILILCIEL